MRQIPTQILKKFPVHGHSGTNGGFITHMKCMPLCGEMSVAAIVV